MNIERSTPRIWRSWLALAVALTTGPALMGADYEIDVHLDPATHSLKATEKITWVNQTAIPAPELQFHLYYNAWKNDLTSFLNSNRITKRDFKDWRQDEWSSVIVDSLVVPSRDGSVEYDLTTFMEFVQNDDLNRYDETVMRVPLPEPVPPGESVTVLLEFNARVPRTFARTGFRGDYYFLAQWFPKLGVFESNGVWNCHQFIQTEFFSDFGSFDVKMTVPSGWVVGATGQLTGFQENGDGTATHRHHQDQVHDFAWTTSPRFLVFEERFEHPTLRPVSMRLLLMPDHLGQQDRYFAAAKAGLKYYGEWFGEYPYDHLTIIDPAYQSNSGGMEYPTLFTGGTRWLNTSNSGSPEGVTVHEFGHQIWYGVIANNEFEDAWMDEGFNTYSTRQTMLEAFGRSNFVKRYLDEFVPVQFDDVWEAPRTVSGLGGLDSELKLDDMSVTSWKYGPDTLRYRRGGGGGNRVYGSGAYGVNSYTKPAIMLLTLHRFLGWETFQKIMSTYFQRWRFRHPRPQDFFDVVNEVSGQDLGWFWDQTYRSSNIFDYSVDGVQKSSGRTRVLLRRWGEGIFPVDVKVTFEKSPPIVEKWDGKSRWKAYDYQTENDDIVQVELDPERVLALDVNTTNNSWVRDTSAPFASRKWAAKWMIWLQSNLQLFSFFS